MPNHDNYGAFATPSSCETIAQYAASAAHAHPTLDLREITLHCVTYHFQAHVVSRHTGQTAHTLETIDHEN